MSPRLKSRRGMSADAERSRLGGTGDTLTMGKDDSGRCPNCARKVHFWHNFSGYCSKECRTDSITSCPNCGKVGLYKHARLGCCSEECRHWYVAGLLGYDRDALLTPSWDRIVYHVRLPSNSAEISSLQLDELEYDRAVDTVLVIAAPAWMTRSKVLAELPYDRFDNAAWQHLWADGTLTEDELFYFHRMCYEDDLLCQKMGEHVFAKLRAPGAAYSPPGTISGYVPATALAPMLSAGYLPAEGQSSAAIMMGGQLTLGSGGRDRSFSTTPSPDFVESVRGVFEGRGYTVKSGAAEHTLLLSRQGRLALAAYYYQGGVVDLESVQRAFAAASAAEATQTFVVTSGRFSLQAEDFALSHPVQLIDAESLADLVTQQRATPTVSTADREATTHSYDLDTTHAARTRTSDEPVFVAPADRIELVEAAVMDTPSHEGAARAQNGAHTLNGAGRRAAVDAEILDGGV